LLTLAVVVVDNIVHRVEVAPEVLVEADQEVQVLVQLTTVMVKQEQQTLVVAVVVAQLMVHHQHQEPVELVDQELLLLGINFNS
tara:strand:- start:8 stop:259 length:252 start_codon:yes stop_codon:yes gene_type:complete